MKVLGSAMVACWVVMGVAVPMRAEAPPHRLSATRLAAAINEYAPILVLHKDERYLPTSIESYLKVAVPFNYEDHESHIRYTGLMLRQQPPYNPADLRGDPDHAKVYVNVKVGAATTEIQYWFCYAYNGPGTAYIKTLGTNPLSPKTLGRFVDRGDFELGQAGVHEGDWEHIMVEIDNATGKGAKGLYMAAHDSGHWYPMETALVKVGNTPRLKVYASKNGHATYLTADRDYNVEVKAGPIEVRLLNDTTKPGLEVDYRNRCEIIGIHGDDELVTALHFKQPDYVAKYPGRWGRIDMKPHPLAPIPGIGDISAAVLKGVGAYRELTFEAGPYPPWSKGSWTGPE